ncbi:MAG TPA: hypothetical protein VNL35_16820 [Chloroflexota bacterium]|nr:hypothetical protein [Chloroflexota bacterium]
MASLVAGTTRRPASAVSSKPADSPNGYHSVGVERPTILEVIGELTADYGRPPARHELLVHHGLSSHRPLTDAVMALDQAGRLRRLPGSGGSIMLRPTEATE